MHAMVREVRVGEVKPTRENIVAEKYISEFCLRLDHSWGGEGGKSYETAELLSSLEHTAYY